ncbi:LysR family transcriptional regulator [Alcaligenaceae bacterium A4P071]|nr:LysR family transcriptional regulator [Alcaligenaceae bacterium A4P071]
MLNYRHLYYFWIVAKEGGFARAAERLDMAIQTISAQVRELEKNLGHQLLKPAGRGVALTDAGEVAFARAESIFQIGQALPQDVSSAATKPTIRLSVGLSDGISKLAAHSLLGPVLDTPDLRLTCHEGEFDQLLGELALHRLDLVLAGQGAPANPNLRLVSDRLVSSPVDWYGPAKWVRRVHAQAFPAVLAELPVLMPTGHSVLRTTLNRWFDDHGLRPNVVGEFEDSALMSVFAAGGMGVFPISRLGGDNIGRLRGLRLLGRCDDVQEEIYAIRNRRGEHHPLVQRVLSATRG